MIRFRESNPVRDIVGAIVFAIAATLLWVESSTASHGDGVAFQDGDVPQAVVSIRSADSLPLDRL